MAALWLADLTESCGHGYFNMSPAVCGKICRLCGNLCRLCGNICRLCESAVVGKDVRWTVCVWLERMLGLKFAVFVW